MKQLNWLVFVSLGLLLVLAGCQSQRSQTSQTPWGELQPRTGGMVLPQPTPVQPAMGEASLPSGPPPPLQVGQELAVVGVDLFRLYADADLKAPVLNVYAAGDTFHVIEASGAITAYPVIRDGRTWYRIQAVDGLVGWILVDAVVPADTE
jgi:hypothetical protein